MSTKVSKALDTDALLALVDASAAQLTSMAEQLTAVAQELRARQEQRDEDDNDCLP